MIYAVGDIHGHLDALKRIIDRVQTDAAEHGIARPRVVFLGDYVDRGPNSKGVLDLLASDDLNTALDSTGSMWAATTRCRRGLP